LTLGLLYYTIAIRNRRKNMEEACSKEIRFEEGIPFLNIAKAFLEAITLSRAGIPRKVQKSLRDKEEVTPLEYGKATHNKISQRVNPGSGPNKVRSYFLPNLKN
jgi:hypothetical protein